jgi:hypothetical protein
MCDSIDFGKYKRVGGPMYQITWVMSRKTVIFAVTAREIHVTILKFV